jgi:hypothetical protein
MAKVWKRTCNGRLRHETAEMARAAARVIEARVPGPKRSTYPCCYCGGWHVARAENVVELGALKRG